MHELLWEIWMGKRNAHHRAQVDLNENPHSTFLRIARELRGSDKEISLTRRDPNTGQKTEVQWKFSWRSEGQEIPLKNHQTFAQQGVNPEGLIVVREVELRAHTIYIDGFEGLGQEEIAAARSKVPLIVGLCIFLLFGGGLGYYFLIYAPAAKARAPYKIAVQTKPEGAEVQIFLDISQVPKPTAKGPKVPAKKGPAETMQRIAVKTPATKISIPKKSRIIFISIAKEGYQTWTAGHPLKVWNKDQSGLRKLTPLYPKELTVKGYFPETLEKPKAPPPPPEVPAPTPLPLQVSYPRRWRTLKLGLDPLHGGLDHQGVKGISGKTAGDLNLAIAKVVTAYLGSIKRRRYRVFASRVADKVTDAETRVQTLQRKRPAAIIQMDFQSGIRELPTGNKNLKKDQKLIPYNDAVGGFLVYYSAQNKAAAKTQKLATCMGTAMKQAGFQPRPPRKGEPATAAALGVRPLLKGHPVLDGQQPAIRLVPGYLTHRGADAVFNQANTHKIIAQAIEAALVCYRK